MNLDNMNPPQKQAVITTEGPVLLLAGAGSGKTRVITHRIAYLIEEKGVEPYNILAITFTNKAANEMRERVDKLVGSGAESIWVSTFHSMCVRILRRFYDKIGGKNNFTIYDSTDQKSLMKETLKALDLDNKIYPEKMMLAAVSKAKEEFLSPEDLERMAGTNLRDMNKARAYAEYQRRLSQNNALDFDDLIFTTIRLFMECPEVLEIYQNRFKYIMVDEYQDTNHTQFLLVKMLADGYRNLCVVGDDDQSIYKFRGANIYNILNFEDEYDDATVIRLEQNYRSTKNILAAANAVIANNEGRKSKTLWTDKDEGEQISYTAYESEHEEALGVVNNIQSIYKNGGAFSDIAVLYRTNNQSRVIEEKLIYANIPYRIYGSTGFYNRKEVMDIVGYLKCIENTDDNISIRRIINVPRRGIGDTTVNKISDLADEAGISIYDICLDDYMVSAAGRAAEKLKTFIGMMEGFRRKAAEGDLLGLYDSILDETGYKNELVAEGTEEAKGRLENLKELKSKIADYCEREETPTLGGLLEEIALVADVDDSTDNYGTVTLMTLHSAKGLEFPYVFIVGMEERLFPSGLSIDSDDPDAVEEERRLCYVGITRAMEKLYLSSANSRMINGNRMYGSVSRFINEIPDELLKRSGFGNRIRTNDAPVRRPEPFKAFAPVRSYGSGSMGSGLSGISKGIPAASPDSFAYEVGDTVRHIKFGKGVVKSKVKTGSDYEVVIDFEKTGEKKMFASLAKLKKV
ncbi:MAG: UvrD-helicase domain-containing protein [Eubacterium sp.]|nr:UvrD-helicase domain-containing protein [Eubacterium sp.]